MERKLRLLTFLIIQITLPTTIVSSSKCRNLKNGTVCVELCCEVTQFYAESFQECVYIQDDISTWYALLQKMASTQAVNFAEYGQCTQFNETAALPQSVISSCYSPHYDIDAKRYILKEFFQVPCSRLPVHLPPTALVGLAALLVTPVLLPIMLLYTCTRKGKKDILSFKLVTWYLTSMIATILTILLRLYIEETEHSEDSWLLYLIILPEFFSTSTFLWLSCIGFNVYIQYKEANEPNSKHKDHMRFIWFSFYVWGTTFTIYVVSVLILSSIMVADGPMYFIACFNVFAFLVLSVKICEIRCRIAHLTSEKHLKCHLLLKILRLSLLMGIPRMLMVILEPLPLIGSTTYIFIIFLEPYIVFMAFIADNDNFRSLLLCRWCRPGNQDLERTMSTETNRTN